MKQTIRHNVLSMLVVGFILAPMLISPVANARQSRGSDSDTSTSTSTNSSSGSEKASDDASSSANETEVENHVSTLRKSAEQEVEKHKQEKGSSTLSEEKRKLVCENRQDAINNKLTAFVAAAQKHLTRLNDVYVKVQAYQEANQYDIANYSDLIAAADSKKQAAVDAVSALQSVASGVDCNDPTSVVKLSTVRDAAKAARTALHDYRKSIKSIVLAIDQAKESQTTSTDTTGGAQ